MSRIKDLKNEVLVMGKVLATMQTAQGTVSADLYASIKEVSGLKYQIVELDLRLSNLEEMVKALTEKGGS